MYIINTKFDVLLSLQGSNIRIDITCYSQRIFNTDDSYNSSSRAFTKSHKLLYDLLVIVIYRNQQSNEVNFISKSVSVSCLAHYHKYS